MKNTLIFGVFLAVMVCIGTIAGCALTNAMTGESPVAIVMRWREEDVGGATKPENSAKKSSTDDSGEKVKQNSKKSPPDLSGEWKQKNSNSNDSWQSAIISGDTIEVFWVADSGDTKSLYWSGTFISPETADEPYSWDSENNHERTDMSLSALGTTAIIRLEKES